MELMEAGVEAEVEAEVGMEAEMGQRVCTRQ